MRRPLAKLTAIVALTFAGAFGVLASSGTADAKATYDSAYGYDRTWNAALRMLRVDMGLKITEKDDQSGYVLFEYRSAETGSRATAGSLELVRGRETDEPIKVLVQLVEMPSYHEQVIADSLARKMRHEYGDPPPRRKPAPPATPQEPVDAGADGST